MTAPGRERPSLTARASGWGSVAVAVLLAILAVCVVVPFDPGMPGIELDSSWAVALNQAVAQGLAFGRQVVFSFGPYVSVYSRVYHPDTYLSTIVASLFLAAGTAAALWLLTQGSKRRLAVALGLLLIGAMSLPDIPLFLYPVLLALLCLRQGQSCIGQAAEPAPDGSVAATPPLACWLLALLFVPMGLLPLIKGTLLLLGGLIGGGCLAYLAHRQRPGDATACVAVSLASLATFWVGAGQSLADLPEFARSIREIISGYTEAMALTGRIGQIVLFAAVAAGLLWLVARQHAVRSAERLLLGWTLALFLFISFKGGFVRHDTHAMMAAAALPVAALWLGLVIKHSRAWVMWTLIALVAWAGMHYMTTPHAALYLASQLRAKLVGPAVAWQRVVGTAPSNAERFEASLQAIRSARPLPSLHGPVDIYPHDQSHLIASGNEWRPRPVPQSYSAYTPRLLAMNRDHLLDDAAPKHILFAIKAIDNRFPTLDDSASWPVLLSLYRPHEALGDFVHLQRVRGASAGVPRCTGQASRHALGTWISLSPSDTPTWAEIDLQPTAAGRVATALFRSSRVSLAVRLANGRVRSFRLVTAIARSGFMLSPLVTEARDFALLWAPPQWLADQRVTEFMLTMPPAGRLLWQPEFTVRVGSIDGLQPAAATRDFALDPSFMDRLEPAPELAAAASVDCDAIIDRVNGLAPSNAKLRASMLLSVNGWLSPAAREGLLADHTFVTLTADDGRRWLLSTRASDRTDIAGHFGQPGLKRCGFETTVDVATLAADDGRFTLGLAYSGPEGLVRCTKTAVPLTFSEAAAAARP